MPKPRYFSSLDSGLPPGGRPLGAPGRLTHPHIPSASLRGYPGQSASSDPRIRPHQRPPRPARAHTFWASSGKLELLRTGAGDLACQFGSLGLAGAPNQPLFSGHRAAGPGLPARSYSGRCRAAAGSARRRGGTLSVCARRGLYLHPKQNNYTFVGGRKPVIRRGLFAAKQFLSGTPV